MRKHFIKAKPVEQKQPADRKPTNLKKEQQSLKVKGRLFFLLFSTVSSVTLHHLALPVSHDLCTNVNTNKVHTKFIHWTPNMAPSEAPPPHTSTQMSIILKVSI